MPVSTLSSKGQITLPAQVRRKLKMMPNDRLVIEVRDGTIVISRAPDLFSFKGFLGKAIPEGQERERMRRAAAAHVKDGPS
jgi:AbrB family looped-hinge helix DNA binding protein